MNATHALGWGLVHFLWQGAALAIVLGVALALIRPTAARARYTFAILTLAAMLVVPVTTTLRLYEPTVVPSSATAAPSFEVNASRPPSPSPTPRAAGADVKSLPWLTAVSQSNLGGRFTLLRDRLEPVLPWLVVAWMLGVLILSVRLAYGWMAARRLRTHGTRDVSAALQDVLARLAARLRVNRPVRLLESLLVEVPAVIGWLRPVVLVPASALTGLTPQQLEVLLAHELAHVRRYDYLVNLVQCVIETLLFYHPAVWWVSRRIREEREHCCDDLAVRVCGDPHLYATALVSMERIRATTPRLALAATGGGGSLITRVRRLVLPTTGRTEHFPRWAAGLAGLLAVTVARRDRDSDVQRQAVETLGNLKDERAYSLLVDVARTNPSSDVRRKAIETLGESGHPDSVLAVLSDLARRTNDPEAAQEAIETLGEMKDVRAFAVIARVARTPGDVDVRRKALETYVESASSDSALALLKSILASNAPEDMNSKVLETLEEMDGGAGIPLLIETARSHPNRDIRADALRRLAESDDPRAQKVFDQTLRRP